MRTQRRPQNPKGWKPRKYEEKDLKSIKRVGYKRSNKRKITINNV